MKILALLTVFAFGACKGKQDAPTSPTQPQAVVTLTDAPPAVSVQPADPNVEVVNPCGQQPADTEEVAPAGGGATYFLLRNEGKEDLVLSLDKGWQPILYAYSGVPPKAKSIIMFPMHCTAACTETGKALCPYCPEPERVKDIMKSEKRKVITPGQEIKVAWSGNNHVYKKTRAGKKRCQCYETEPAPPETYTVKACGFRVTKSATERSKYQCASATMAWPAQSTAGEDTVVELVFP